MANWFRNFLPKKNQDEPLEDFVLYNADSEEGSAADEVEIENDASFGETSRLDLSVDRPKKDIKSFFLGDKKKMLLRIGIPAIALLLIIALLLTIPVLTNPLRGYAQATVTRGNIISSLNVSGTLSANAHYSITSTVSGTVLDAPIEVGDRVEAGTILFQLDDSDAQLALKRAENQLEKSKAVGSSSVASQKIYSPESGTIQSIVIRSGQTVSAGQVVGTIKRADDSVVSITSMVSGTVYSVNVSSGSSVSAGSLIASIQDSQAELARRANEYDKKSNEYDVEAAESHINNYTIVSPISGIVTEKNAKVGDNVSIADNNKPMMVVSDTSSMRFTIQVDESKISEVKPGLRASVTTDSVPNKTFSGKIKSISPEGTRNKEGKLVFDVEVLVENPGSLKSGMNVSAKVVLATANNTLHVPKKALRNPDGKTAVVLVKSDSKTTTSTTSSSSKKAEKAKIEIPKGCRLVTVQYGVSDNDNVQIISGLKRGEIVVYLPEWEVPNLKLASTAVGQPNSSAAGIPTTSDSTTTDAEEEAIRREIMEKVEENQTQS